jgi:glycosyltransferase involved in cell wall biosynthesis
MRSAAPHRAGPGLRLGFAALWEPEPAPTWSWIPWNLRRALAQRVDVVDLGVRLPRLPRRALAAAYARRRDGAWVTAWPHAPLPQRAVAAAVTVRARRRAVDAVLQVGDLATPDAPTWVFQDLSFDVLMREEAGLRQFPHLDGDDLRRLRDRQHRLYAHATGVLAMSRWFATTLVEWTGLPPERVHLVHPGVSAGAGAPPSDDRRLDAPRHRLLFVGRDFHRKGGDLVVAAFERLRADDPTLTLTVAGPDRWPLAGDPPPGVRFQGRVDPDGVRQLYDEHDLFVMPSRFEAFGIVFVEALARGLPCIGRDAYAMPEVIRPGHDGALVTDDDPDALAATVRQCLDDDGLHRRCWEQRHRVARTFTWERAADDVCAIVGDASTLAPAPTPTLTPASPPALPTPAGGAR